MGWRYAVVVVGLALTASACSELTQIVVVVDSDLEVPASLDAVRVDVSGAGPNGSASSTARLEGQGAVELPVVLGLVHRGGPLGPIEITATGMRDGADVGPTRRARLAFVSGRAVMLRMDLVALCAGLTCDETCDAGGCRSIDVAPSELLDWPGQAPRLGDDAGSPVPDAGVFVPDSGARDGGADGGRPDAGEGDSDGDTVPNAEDNCPTTANLDQANEDGDATGDACDLCPAFSDAGEDGDGDGVGNACDPRPAMGGDSIVAFAGFGAGVPSGWTAAGSVTASGGEATLTAGSGEAALLTIARPAGGRVHVWAAAVPVSAPGPTILGTGVAMQFSAGSADDSVACQLVDQDSGWLRLFASAAGGALSEAGHAMVLGNEYVFRGSRQGNDYTCAVSSPDATIMGTSTQTAATPHIGIRSRNGTSRYRWVMVLASP